MGSGAARPLRSLARFFVKGVPDPAPEVIELGDDEHKKVRKVLRLKDGDEIAILPGDGRLLRCEVEGKAARVLDAHMPATESPTILTLGLALAKPDALETGARMATEIGVARIVLFPSDRTVTKWDEQKRARRLERLKAIAREACEVSFRVQLPAIEFSASLEAFLERHPDAAVLSEREDAPPGDLHGQQTLVIGPEGGWSPREVELIGDRAVGLGPRVLRVDTAIAAACALNLLG